MYTVGLLKAADTAVQVTITVKAAGVVPFVSEPPYQLYVLLLDCKTPTEHWVPATVTS
jgi:hypothetical protein